MPVTDLRPWRPIKWSCETAQGEARQGIIAHNSAYATLKSGKRVAYGDHCPQGKPTS